MTQQITPFLMFNDQAGEAMEFYVSLFPNSRILSTLPAPDGKVAAGNFELNGQRLMCYNGGPKSKFEQGLSLMYSPETRTKSIAFTTESPPTAAKFSHAVGSSTNSGYRGRSCRRYYWS